MSENSAEEVEPSESGASSKEDDESFEAVPEQSAVRTSKNKKSDTTSGIIYLSRIPPFMKPHKVKHLLSHYGSVGRIYLQSEGEHLKMPNIYQRLQHCCCMITDFFYSFSKMIQSVSVERGSVVTRNVTTLKDGWSSWTREQQRLLP